MIFPKNKYLHFFAPEMKLSGGKKPWRVLFSSREPAPTAPPAGAGTRSTCCKISLTRPAPHLLPGPSQANAYNYTRGAQRSFDMQAWQGHVFQADCYTRPSIHKQHLLWAMTVLHAIEKVTAWKQHTRNITEWTIWQMVDWVCIILIWGLAIWFSFYLNTWVLQ